MLLLRLRCVVEILMLIVHWYVTSKALVMIASGIPCSDHRVESEFCSGIASLAFPNLGGGGGGGKHWPSMQNKFAYQGKSPFKSPFNFNMERFMHSVTCLLHTKQANGCSLVS